MTKHLPRARVVGGSLIGISALALSVLPGALAATTPAGAPPAATTTATTTAATAAEPTVLDSGTLLAIAGDGTNVAWLHADYGPGGGRPTKVTLWTRDAGGEVAQVQQALPSQTRDLAIGDDGKGTTTIVLNGGGSSKTGPTALYALPADGSKPAHRLRASLPAGKESAPGLLRGVLSFSREERTRKNGVKHATVRLGSLTSSSSRLASDGKRGSDIDQTTPTASSGVAYVTSRPDDVGADFELRVLRAGHASKLLSRTSFGGASEAGYGALVTTDAGRRLVAARWEDGGGHPSDRTTYAVPAGTRVGAVEELQPGEQDLGVPVADGHVYVGKVHPDDFDEKAQLLFRPAG